MFRTSSACPAGMPLTVSLTAWFWLAAMAFWALPEASGQTVFDEIRKTREKTGKQMAGQAKTLAGARCFFAMKQYLDLASWLDGENKEIKKMAEFYSFVPELPSFFSDFSWEELCRDSEIRKNKHKRTDDRKALDEFHSRGLNDALCGHIAALEAVPGQGEERADALGNEVTALFGFLEKKHWCGIIALSEVKIGKFTSKAEAFLKSLGWIDEPSYPGSRTKEWVSPRKAKDDSARKELDEATKRFRAERERVIGEKYAVIRKDLAARPSAGPSPFEEKLGIRLQKLRSDHFQVEAPLADHQVIACLAVQEAAFREFLNLMKIPDPGIYENPIKTVVLDSAKLYREYVMEMSSFTPEEKKFTAERTSGTGDPGLGYYVECRDSFDPMLREAMVAGALYFMLARSGYAKFPLWVFLGLQYVLTLEVLGTADVSYISMAPSTGKQETYEWFNYYRWKRSMKEAERAGVAPSTDAILALGNVNELVDVQRAKMYCLVAFLSVEQLDRFKKILECISSTGWSRGADGEFAALRAAGWSTKELDEEYRKHITR